MRIGSGWIEIAGELWSVFEAKSGRKGNAKGDSGRCGANEGACTGDVAGEVAKAGRGVDAVVFPSSFVIPFHSDPFPLGRRDRSSVSRRAMIRHAARRDSESSRVHAFMRVWRRTTTLLRLFWPILNDFCREARPEKRSGVLRRRARSDRAWGPDPDRYSNLERRLFASFNTPAFAAFAPREDGEQVPVRLDPSGVDRARALARLVPVLHFGSVMSSRSLRPR